MTSENRAEEGSGDAYLGLILDLHPKFPSYKSIDHAHIIDAEFVGSCYDPDQDDERDRIAERDLKAIYKGGVRLQDAIVTTVYRHGEVGSRQCPFWKDTMLIAAIGS